MLARRPMNIRVMLLAGAVGGLCLGASTVAAAGAPAAPATKVPVTAHPKGHYAALDALPDWGGVWVSNRPAGAPGTPGNEKPALKGKYLEDYQAWQHAVETKGG